MAFVETEKKADFNVTSSPGKSSNHAYSLWSGTESKLLGIFFAENAQFLQLLQHLPKDWILKVSDLLSTVMVRHYWWTCPLNLVCWSVWEPWQRYFLLWCSEDHTAQPPMKALPEAQQAALRSWENKPWAHVFLASVTLQEEMCLHLMIQKRIISA